MISAVNSLRHFQFMTVERGVNATVFTQFLQCLITGMEQQIFFNLDGHPAHKAKLVQRYIEENRDRVELFFLPPYAAELNPDELV